MATVIYGRRGPESPHLFPPPRTVGEDEEGKTSKFGKFSRMEKF